MKPYTLLWAALIIVGLYGALRYSSVFFGLFTAGLFLIIYNRRTGEGKAPTVMLQPVKVAQATCPNCGAVLDSGAAFCPRCGGKVKRE